MLVAISFVVILPLFFVFAWWKSILIGAIAGLLAATVTTIIVFCFDFLGRYLVFKSCSIWCLETEVKRVFKVYSVNILFILKLVETELNNNSRFCNVIKNDRINIIKVNTRKTIFSRCDDISIALFLKNNQYIEVVLRSKPTNNYAIVDDGRNTKNLYVIEKDIRSAIHQECIECSSI